MLIQTVAIHEPISASKAKVSAGKNGMPWKVSAEADHDAARERMNELYFSASAELRAELGTLWKGNAEEQDRIAAGLPPLSPLAASFPPFNLQCEHQEPLEVDPEGEEEITIHAPKIDVAVLQKGVAVVGAENGREQNGGSEAEAAMGQRLQETFPTGSEMHHEEAEEQDASHSGAKFISSPPDPSSPLGSKPVRGDVRASTTPIPFRESKKALQAIGTTFTGTARPRPQSGPAAGRSRLVPQAPRPDNRKDATEIADKERIIWEGVKVNAWDSEDLAGGSLSISAWAPPSPRPLRPKPSASDWRSAPPQ